MHQQAIQSLFELDKNWLKIMVNNLVQENTLTLFNVFIEMYSFLVVSSVLSMFSVYPNYYTTTLNELSIKTKPNSIMVILNIIWTQPHISVLTLVLT